MLRMRSRWMVLMASLVLVGVLGLAPRASVGATESKEAVTAQLLLDGEVVGNFAMVSEIKMEIEQLAYVCRSDARDDDCDGASTEAWQAEVLTALWELEATAGRLEEQGWFSSRAKHDAAMNAIRNMKGLAHELTHVVQQSSSAKTGHDTVKNSIGNIRAMYRVINSIAIDETGVHAAIRELGRSVDSLTGLAGQTAVRYRPGRPVYGNITFEGKLGENPKLWQWVNEVREGKHWRKSGSVIYLDRAGQEVLRINLFECWPVAYSTGMAVEKVEIAVERIERASK